MTRTFAAALFAASFLASAPAALAQAKQNFQLINKTGYELSELYVSPTKTDDWEEDVLGQSTLEDGDKTTIRFNRSTKTCFWDLKVVYSDDDSSAVWTNINLCEVSRITIRYNRKSDTSTATFD